MGGWIDFSFSVSGHFAVQPNVAQGQAPFLSHLSWALLLCFHFLEKTVLRYCTGIHLPSSASLPRRNTVNILSVGIYFPFPFEKVPMLPVMHLMRPPTGLTGGWGGGVTKALGDGH